MTPRLSGGWKPLAEAQACLFFVFNNVLYTNQYFTLPELTHAPNVCDSFAKSLKNEMFGCKAKRGLLSSIVICIVDFIQQNGSAVTKFHSSVFQAYIFNKHIALICIYSAALRNDERGPYDCYIFAIICLLGLKLVALTVFA